MTEALRRRRGRLLDAERWFFPAAALYGALAVPLSVHGLLGGRPLLPGLGTVAGHAHELLFGTAGFAGLHYPVLRVGVPAALGLAAACWSLAMLVLLITLLCTEPLFSQRF